MRRLIAPLLLVVGLAVGLFLVPHVLDGEGSAPATEPAIEETATPRSAPTLTSPADLPAIEPAPTPDPEPVVREVSPTQEAVYAATRGQGAFIVPGVSLSVPLRTMPVSDGIVDPPNFEDAFLVEGYGTPGGNGTVYVALHSARHREDAPGNALIDVGTASSRVREGSMVIVDGVRYQIVEVRTIGKPEVVSESDLWVPVDGRLVVFTCLQRDTGRSLEVVALIGQEVHRGS